MLIEELGEGERGEVPLQAEGDGERVTEDLAQQAVVFFHRQAIAGRAGSAIF